MPRADFIQDFSNYWNVSIHLMNGSVVIQAMLFLIAGVFAVALLLGYRTRFVTFVSWFLLVSLQSRNFIINQGGDTLLRVLLFWSMFLPLGACYSLDAALNTSQRKMPQRIVSAASVAVLFQICFMYWFTVVLKSGATWKEGNAIYYALNIDQLATPLGHYLLNFPRLLKFLTYSTIWFERLGPLLPFIPFFTGPLRTAAVFLFILFHFGMGLCLKLGIFSYVSAVAWLVFLPSWFWEKIFYRLRTPERLGLKIYYDEGCDYCKKSALIFKTFFSLPETALLAAQIEPSIFAEMQGQNSWVVVDSQGKRHFGFEALTYLCWESPVLWVLSPLFRWRPFARRGEKIYEKISLHRKEGKRFLSWLHYRPLVVRSSLITQIVVAFLLLCVFLYNLQTLNPSKYNKIFIQKIRGIARFLSLNQSWKMFARNPFSDDGWYVVPGELKNGAEVDLLKGSGPVTWEKPKFVSSTSLYKNDRWGNYLINLRREKLSTHPRLFAQYLCREWNSRHEGEEQLASLSIYFMRENTLPDYQNPTPKKVLFLDYDCFKKTGDED